MAREKKAVIKDITKEQAEDAFANYSKNNSQLKGITAKMELELTKVREKYSSDLDVLTDNRDKSFAVLQTYALENENLFDKKKSFEMTHGKIGFRTGTPQVKNLKGFTWEAVKNLVKTFLGESYVRVKEEVNKDAILAVREDEELSKLFTQCGFEVRQEETFFVEAKEEEVAAV